MGTVERVAVLLVIAGMLVTLAGKDKNTAGIVQTVFNGFNASLRTSEGR